VTKERGFKGVWIPAEVWLDTSLSIMEKLFLVEIDSLDNEDGCYASNAHFAEFFGVTKGRCTQVIKSLEKKGLVNITVHRDGKQITKRTIHLVNKLNTLVNKLNYPSENIKQGYLENAQGSNTCSNNTNKTKNTDHLEEWFEQFWTVFDNKVGKKKARLAFIGIDGLDEALFKKIISAAQKYHKLKHGTQYYKHPTTWINGEHWDDELVLAKTGNTSDKFWGMRA
jgi:DNA-binding MarR family transcriptional regulator